MTHRSKADPALAHTEFAVPLSPSIPPRASVPGTGEDFFERSELGRGGMAVVMLAEQRSLGREVALKRLLGHRPDAETLLLHEAVITGQLEHPNIVPVHAIVNGPHGPAVVLKRVSGVSFDRWLASPDASRERALEIFLQVCNAIAFAHSRGVVHLDVKPANVMIGDFGEVYVMDWGIARRVSDPRDSAVIGTPCYMAPEMTRGEFSVASDVFLLGAMLHEILTGRPPYPVHDAMVALEAARDCAPLAFDPAVPDDLVEVCRWACAKVPSERPPSATAVREAVALHRERRTARKLLERAEQSGASLRARVGAAQRDPAWAAAIAARFSEARLAYEQALEIWPEAPRAREGLRTLLADMIEHELSMGHSDAALALLSSMENPAGDFEATVRARASAIETARNRLSILEREVDPNVGAASRGRAFAAFGSAVLVMVGVLIASRASRPDFVPDTRRLAVVGTVVLALLLGAVVMWAWRRDLNQANRRIAALCVAMLTASALHRWSAVWLGTAPEQVLVADAFLLAIGGLALGFFHRAGFWLTGLALAVAAVGTFSPSWVDDAFTALSLGVPALAYAMRATDVERPTGDSMRGG